MTKLTAPSGLFRTVPFALMCLKIISECCRWCGFFIIFANLSSTNQFYLFIYHAISRTKVITSAFIVAAALIMLPSCSDDDTTKPEASNAIPDQEVGIRELKLSMPRMGRFDGVVEHASCRIHITGSNDRVTYPINVVLSASEETLSMEAEDPILAELPHQLYHLNYITFPHKHLTKAEDASEAEVKEDTVFVGARLSIVDPDNIAFMSSFNVGADRIGAGTEDDPYAVASGMDFKNYICNPMVHGETHEGVYFEITRNINLNSYDITNGKGWEPAGHNGANGAVAFNGNIDGLNNTLDNLFCFTDDGFGGLFYQLGPKAHIQNLVLSRVSLDGDMYLGALACYSERGARIERVSVDGSIDGTAYIGGFIGKGNATLAECASSITISASGRRLTMKDPADLANGDFVGGFIGMGQRVEFTDCLRTGHIYDGSAKCVGGFVGGGTDEVDRVSITRCYSSGNIEGDDYTGGFLGNLGANITDSHAGATLERDSYTYQLIYQKPVPMALAVYGEDYCGGFVGYAKAMYLSGKNSFMYSSPSKRSVDGDSYVGGLVGYCTDIDDDGASEFTSNAYVEGGDASDYIGGVIGAGSFDAASGTYVNNGTVTGYRYVGGIIGKEETRVLADVTCRNAGTVSGANNYVGGIGGYVKYGVENAVLQSEGNVSGKSYLGGMFGYSGLFMLAEGSYVGRENGSMKIETVDYSGYVGGIAGKMETTFTNESRDLEHCPVNVNIVADASNVGGLVGGLHVKYDISKVVKFFIGRVQYPCDVDITVSRQHFSTGYETDAVGGLFGYIEIESVGSYNPNIDMYYFSDNVQGNIRSNGNYVGGIVGRFKCNRGTLEINSCHNFINLTSTSDTNVDGYGGIIGATLDYEEYVSIEHCSNHGNIYGPSLSASAGIAGLIYNSLFVSACYNAGTIDGTHGIGGIVGRLTHSGKIQYCFNMGDVPWKENVTLLAGIIGQKEDKSGETLLLYDSYNVGSTGWGIIGGESGSKFEVHDVSYLNTASNGDMKNSGTRALSADEMRNSTFKNPNYNVWIFHDGQAAPTLKNMPMFDKPLPLQK